MTRASGLLLALALIWAAQPSAQQADRSTGANLVSTWTLTAFEPSVNGGAPARVANPRGLLVFDAAGHVFEFVTSLASQRPINGQMALADAQTAFSGYGGFWGGYRVDAARKTITIRPESGISPLMKSSVELSRSFELDDNRLTITSIADPHTAAGTRWVWERVPTIDNLSPLYRRVVGFWLHIVEKRVNQTAGTMTESKRSPSVIVYTPAGFVGVHFPPLNRKPFASDTPTPEEARAALSGYIGYFGALTVYPGQVFHNILAGVSPTQGTILKRAAEIVGDELTVRLPTTRNQQGQEAQTIVTLKRLSGEAEMIP